KHSTRYVLVIIDNFSRFNRVYLLTQKSQAEAKLLSFINEIKNKIHRLPAYLHSDRGGEFNSTQFRTNVEAMGIVFERGPANSPQTNGIAERFNQALLTKCRCLLAQSNVPINFWDEAVKYSSLLINNLPSRSLNWNSPVFVSRSMGSKILPPSKPLLYLGPEDYSDAGRFFDPQSHRIVISQDYTPTNLKFDYHSPDSVKKPTTILPYSPPIPNTFTTIPLQPSSPNLTSQQQPTLPNLSPPTQEPPDVPIEVTEPEEPIEHQPTSVSPASPSRIPIPQKKGYSYVPHFTTAPQNISSSISRDNILTSSRRNKSATGGNPPSSSTDEDLFLNEDVPFKTALQDPIEAPRWKEAMDKEFNSLTSKNTGTLVPSPGTDKTIGGMWRLVRKRNEFGEVLKYKACWVCFGNHQEHQVNYFDTYSAVARTESFKVLLSILVNRKYSAYQFDVETAFLYGEMDAPNYVTQVANYEVPGKEDWVWKLNKSLYGTKQAPRQWKAHLVNTLNLLGLSSKDTDKCLFTNHNKTLFLHIHVDDGFIVGESESMIKDLLTLLNQTYTIKTKKYPTQHLGYTLDWQSDGSIIIHQLDFCTKILEEFNMLSSNSIKTPAPANIHNTVAQTSTPFSKHTMQKAIGMLNYLALHTRPDIMFTTNLLSQFISKPTMSHWNLVKHLLRYLNGTRGLGLHYTKTQQHESKLAIPSHGQPRSNQLLHNQPLRLSLSQ
ncbi:hypothetical protein O181_110315, partial [Austropuccinia psidii MF-1]|nr:hypothetical protein [Austropuccinia psidii MF-1]